MRSIHVVKRDNQGIGVLLEIEQLNKDHVLGRGKGAWVVKAVVPTRLHVPNNHYVMYHDVVEVDVLIELE